MCVFGGGGGIREKALQERCVSNSSIPQDYRGYKWNIYPGDGSCFMF